MTHCLCADEYMIYRVCDCLCADEYMIYRVCDCLCADEYMIYRQVKFSVCECVYIASTNCQCGYANTM